jgi:diacylglycerol kinase family enzyme
MRRVLLVSNPKAGSVSRRASDVITRALAADLKLETAVTRARGHASELSAEAVAGGFDAVIAFGGDGTVNEVAQPLVGTDVALGIVPGGTTNVMARALGMPRDPVEATSYLAARIRSSTMRRIGVGQMGTRSFLFCCGMGLDAEVVRRVEAQKTERGVKTQLIFLKHALITASTEYRTRGPLIDIQVEGHEPVAASFAVCCNARPFTYLRGRAVDACPGAGLDHALDMLTVKGLTLPMIPRIAWALLVSRSHVRWRSTGYFSDLTEARLRSATTDPIQVDGDHIGATSETHIRYIPDALSLYV